jgi:hypothetical protein
MLPLERQDVRAEWRDPMPFFDYRGRFREDKARAPSRHRP